MRSTAIFLLVAVSLALGALVIHQNGRLEKLQTENGALQGQLKEVTTAAEKAQAAEHKASVLQNALNDTAADANAQTRQVADLQSKLAAAKTNALAGAGKGTN